MTAVPRHRLMISRPSVRAAALAATLLGLAVSTAGATSVPGPVSGQGASSGGAGLNASGSNGSATGTSGSTTSASGPASATPVGGPVSTQGNGFTLSTSAAGTYQQTLTFSGSVPGSDSGDVVAIQRQVSTEDWQTVDQATVAADGSFDAAWRPSTSGVVAFRATLEGPPGSLAAASDGPASASPVLAVTIYRDAIATIYGPGFYGRRTACGFKLTPSMLGVASRTLKCGTKVSLDYDGQTITVPVIDRGPYANGATWDLTEATASALDDPDTETVGAAVL